MTRDDKMTIAREMAAYLGVRNVNHVELNYIIAALDSAEARGKEAATKTMLEFIKMSAKGAKP